MALFVYGDLDISIINEMPKDRIPIETFCVTTSYRERIYKFILKQVAEKKQTYIVCPLIEHDDDKNNTENLVDVTNYIEQLKSGLLQNLSIELLHSKIKPAQKNEIMKKFSNREIDVLVSTTVIEVGVDVPSATLMIIENAERFGLSQLHQLRGRVGRGKDKSYCILISEKENSARLKIMTESTDGFFLAEQDLKLRGIGDFFGTRQHGMPKFRLVSVYDDTEIISMSKKSAQKLLAEDPLLEKEINLPLKILIKNMIEEEEAGKLN